MNKLLLVLAISFFFSLTPSPTEAVIEEESLKPMYGYVENGVTYVSPEQLGLDDKLWTLSKTLEIQGESYVPFREAFEALKMPFRYLSKDQKIQFGDRFEQTIHLKPITSAYLYDPEKIYAVMYHEFGIGEPESLYVTEETFRDQLEMYKREGFETITDQDVIAYKNDPSYKLPEKPLLITIDDGYIGNYTIAYPLLQEYGFRATVYVISDRRDQGYEHHFSWEQALEMEESGVMNIEDHTYDHHDYVDRKGGGTGPMLTTIQPHETYEDYIERITSDLQRSKERIEEKLQKKVVTLSFPYGAYNDDVVEVARSLGYELFITIKADVNTRENVEDGFIYRHNVDGRLTADELLEILEN